MWAVLFGERVRSIYFYLAAPKHPPFASAYRIHPT
jgi:hypothetical protein